MSPKIQKIAPLEILQPLANSRESRAYFREPDIAHRDGTAWLTRQSRSNRPLHQNSLLTGKLTRKFAVSGVVLQILHPINAKLQSLAVKFPKKKNREFFEANREITKLNRDQPAAVRHHLALPRHGSHWREKNWDPTFSICHATG
jgi:hypothetical protein